jgi:hypothetical protein
MRSPPFYLRLIAAAEARTTEAACEAEAICRTKGNQGVASEVATWLA